MVKGSRRLLIVVVLGVFLTLASYLAFWVWVLWNVTRPWHG